MAGPACSDLARRAGEPLGGTASHARGCVLVSYPKRLWARDALSSTGLPEAVRGAARELADRHDVVTRLVAHEGEWRDEVEVTFFPQARRHRAVPLAEVATLLRTAAPDAGEPVVTPLVLVCTHGVRDACCARLGLGLVRALRDAAGDRIDVREASHLGGDRFAPTALVLPSGHTYGHLELTEAAALVEATLGGPLLAARFRGTLYRDPLEQLAEVAAWQLATARSARVVGLGAVTRRLEGQTAVLVCDVELDLGAIALEVRCTEERRLVVGDCRSARLDRRGAVSTWVIRSVSGTPR